MSIYKIICLFLFFNDETRNWLWIRYASLFAACHNFKGKNVGKNGKMRKMKLLHNARKPSTAARPMPWCPEMEFPQSQKEPGLHTSPTKTDIFCLKKRFDLFFCFRQFFILLFLAHATWSFRVPPFWARKMYGPGARRGAGEWNEFEREFLFPLI